MKKELVFFRIFLICLSQTPLSEIGGLFSQALEQNVSNSKPQILKVKQLTEENEILPIGIELAFNKTTSLVFPNAIRSVDLGSKSIMADKAINIENVLNVKASLIGFNETNFSVITNDGRFYSFICNYNEYPKSLAYNLINYEYSFSQAKKIDIKFLSQWGNENNGDNMSDVAENTELVRKKREYKITGIEANDIVFRVTGLFIKNNTYYIKVKIQNYSNINYDIDFNKFYIQDEKTFKQTASQEYELVPIFKSPKNKETILANSAIENVFAFDKFTFSQGKVLKVMLNEKGGGRNLGLVLDEKVVGGVRVLK
jgi:conjugative transposon TraN protein